MIRVGIVGITGYTGEELLKILLRHPNVKIVALYGRSSSKDRRLKDIYSHFSHLDLKINALNIEQVGNECDVVFLALPHAVAFEIVPSLFETGVKIIDLSADFRLNSSEIYERWYNVKHAAKEYVGRAVYGLSELNTDEIKKAFLIANPGCYPTTVILGCAPAIKSYFVDLKHMIIDSKSGVSGCGRKSAQEYFNFDHPNFKAYKIAGTHRHIPEIEQELSKLSKKNVTINFTPHIIPIERGMLSTIYVDIKKQASLALIIDKYREFYKNREFVKVLDEDVIPTIKDVLNTNYCRIGMKIDKRTNKLIIISVIDNLLKGASGQAVQNMNLMFDLPETIGLI
ncbi:MAG: N-acetyl-gamma-glutamyl-phosphate reductase [Endomicrobium sp.]|nr:N-acetyl-gamma-glutamyl-phosphate reductase [Endomicrobium sp.]